MSKMTADQLQSELRHFCGSESFHCRKFMGQRIAYTDGVKFLADEAGAHWLIDLILSAQSKVHKACDGFQSWELKLNTKDTGCVVTCDDGNGNVKFKQEIEFTDFPLDEIGFFVCDNQFSNMDGTVPTIMLKNEY